MFHQLVGKPALQNHERSDHEVDRAQPGRENVELSARRPLLYPILVERYGADDDQVPGTSNGHQEKSGEVLP